MQIVIVAPCLAPRSTCETNATPPQLAIHLAASTPVRHHVKIVDTVANSLRCAPPTDLYVLLWTHAFSPALIEIAMQLAACERLVCLWDGPTLAPVDYLLEFCDHVICTPQAAQWQQLLATVEAEHHQLA